MRITKQRITYFLITGSGSLCVVRLHPAANSQRNFLGINARSFTVANCANESNQSNGIFCLPRSSKLLNKHEPTEIVSFENQEKMLNYHGDASKHRLKHFPKFSRCHG